MKRFMFTAATSVVVLALAPASALARHHHQRPHSRTHHARVHHTRVLHRRFGDVNSPTTPTPAAIPTADSAGTVASFTNGILTIKLNDSSTVSGAVTNDTEIECEAAESTGTIHEDGDGDHGGGGERHGSNGDGHGDQNDQGEQNQNCTTADLMPGAMVRGAELRLSSAGATWEKVELIG
jgi:hypothetical protein